MSADVRPLPIHPWPIRDEPLDLLKRAKAELDLPFQIAPVPAVPGSPGRILCLGSLAPMVCEAVLVKDPTSYESVLNALRFTLMAPAGAAGSFDEADYLHALLGAVEILDPEELAKYGVSVWDQAA